MVFVPPPPPPPLAPLPSSPLLSFSRARPPSRCDAPRARAGRARRERSRALRLSRVARRGAGRRRPRVLGTRYRTFFFRVFEHSSKNKKPKVARCRAAPHDPPWPARGEYLQSLGPERSLGARAGSAEGPTGARRVSSRPPFFLKEGGGGAKGGHEVGLVSQVRKEVKNAGGGFAKDSGELGRPLAFVCVCSYACVRRWAPHVCLRRGIGEGGTSSLLFVLCSLLSPVALFYASVRVVWERRWGVPTRPNRGTGSDTTLSIGAGTVPVRRGCGAVLSNHLPSLFKNKSEPGRPLRRRDTPALDSFSSSTHRLKTR